MISLLQQKTGLVLLSLFKLLFVGYQRIIEVRQHLDGELGRRDYRLKVAQVDLFIMELVEPQGYLGTLHPSFFELLFHQVPDLQERFIKMALVSNEWDRLVAAWPAIIAAMDDEVPGWRDGRTQGLATKAYQLIQTAIGR